MILGLLAGCSSDGQIPVEIAPEQKAILWIAPVYYEDGDLITDLAGFNLYINGERIDLPNPGQFEYYLDLAPERSYRVYITAYLVNGVESKPSQVLEF